MRVLALTAVCFRQESLFLYFLRIIIQIIFYRVFIPLIISG